MEIVNEQDQNNDLMKYCSCCKKEGDKIVMTMCKHNLCFNCASIHLNDHQNTRSSIVR